MNNTLNFYLNYLALILCISGYILVGIRIKLGLLLVIIGSSIFIIISKSMSYWRGVYLPRLHKYLIILDVLIIIVGFLIILVAEYNYKINK